MLRYRNLFCLALALTFMPAHAADPMKDPPPPGYYAVQKVVYQNDSGIPDDHAYFSRLLGHIANHLDATAGKAQITVVSFAAGVKLFDMAKTEGHGRDPGRSLWGKARGCRAERRRGDRAAARVGVCVSAPVRGASNTQLTILVSGCLWVQAAGLARMNIQAQPTQGASCLFALSAFPLQDRR